MLTTHPPTDPPTTAPAAIGQALRQQQSTSSIQQSTAYAATTKRMNLLPVCATHSCHLTPLPSHSPPTPTPRPCNACRRLSMHRNLRAAAARAAATPTANSNCWATRDILHTDSDTVCSLLPLPIHPLAPSPTPAVFYLSVGSRHSQLPFRIELNSNFYQFTKATAGKSKERQPGCQWWLGSGAELWEHARG